MMASGSLLAEVGSANPIAAEMSVIDAELHALPDWPARLAHLVDLGRSLPRLPSSALTEAARIHGCQSQLWFLASRREGLVHLEADSDAAIMRGILALLLRLYSDRAPIDIMDHLSRNAGHLDVLGTLAPSRVSGIQLLLRRIEAAASGDRP